MNVATQKDLAAEYARRLAAHTPTAPVTDRRKRRAAKAQEPTMPIWCKVVLAIKAIIKRCKVSQLYSPFTYFSLLGTMRTTTLIAKIHRKMAGAKNKYSPLPDYGDWGAEQYTSTPMSLMLREPICSESDWCGYYPTVVDLIPGMARCDAGYSMCDGKHAYAKPVIADRPNGGGTKHANACNGKSGKWSKYSRSIAEQGKQTYLHGLPPHAVGM